MSTPFLHIKNLSVGYQSGKSKVSVFDDLNFSAQKGETIALVGHNGIGKSTFLRTLANLQQSLNGDYILNGKHISAYTIKEIASILSFVSTELIDVPNLSVFDLVALGRFPYTNWYGRLTTEDIHKCMQSLEHVGMLSFKDNYVNQLSDGERQRVMIARTLAQDTNLVILDEPTAFLDLKNKYEIIGLLNTIAREQDKIFIYSSHDLHIALQSADKLWLMTSNGSFEGAPEDIILQNKLKHLFDSDLLHFDLDKYNFIFEKPKLKSVNIIGEGVEFKLTKIALNRLGIYHQSNSSIQVEVSPKKSNKWQVKSDKAIAEFENLYSLCTYLKTSI